MISLDHSDVLKFLPDRKFDSHKGDYGRLLLLCGSEGFTGAAYLSAMAALRSGAGLVYLGVPRSIYPILATKLTEAIVFPLPDQDGMFSELAIDDIKYKLSRMDAVLIGPGLGQSKGCLSVTQYVLQHFNGPVILDADGINVIKQHKNILRGRTCPTILTPHMGEFATIGGDVSFDRISAAEAFAEAYGIILVLKGHRTVITDSKTTYINSTGNPGMATGGSGDVLAGIITALVGQHLDPLAAAACGAWLHGKSGDICAEEFGQYGMLPSDMLQVLPRLLK